uniref:Malic enzyme NAD-binding domain-containing protein n=1 Tax=Cyanistes caeruleus TaxID=156563 RepID=A0A8C0TZX8_CYACU
MAGPGQQAVALKRCGFPAGVALAVILSSVRHISDKVFLEAAKALAEQLTDEELAQGRLYPPLSNIREVSIYIAVKVSTEHKIALRYKWFMCALTCWIAQSDP